jgi:hypothetical protein
MVSRKDVEELEHVLALTDAMKRQFEADVTCLRRELDDTVSTSKREQQALRMSRDALHEEIQVIRSRLSDALSENDELIRSIEPMEFEIRLLRRQAASHEESASLAGGAGGSSRFGTAGGGGGGGGTSHSSGASSLHRTGDRGYFATDDDIAFPNDGIVPEGSVASPSNNTPALQSREQQLLEVIEQSASVFVSLDQELRSAQAELQRLKAEKQNWQNSEYELQSSIARLEREREQYIARELENTSTYVLAHHSLVGEEAKGRTLLEAQASALLHGLAYQRCRNDAAVISKQLRMQLHALETERSRDHRQHDNLVKFEVERSRAQLAAVHEAALRAMDAKLETMRLDRQKVELQNTLLKANCDEWRAHSEKKDREHEKSSQQLVAEAQAQIVSRDELLRNRDEQVASLAAQKVELTARIAASEGALAQAEDALRRVHADEVRRIELLRSSYVQTDPTESEENMKQRLLREIENEDEVQLARRVTAHHLFVKLQDVTTNVRTLLDEREQEIVKLRQDLQSSTEALSTTTQRLATEERKYMDGSELLRCEADAANRRFDLVQRQREIAERDVAQLQAIVERHQQEVATLLVELRNTTAAQQTAERKSEELSAALESLTSQLGVELSEGAVKTNTLDEVTAAASSLRSENLHLQRVMLEQEESACRSHLSHSVDLILLRLSAIAESIWSGTTDA